MPRSSIFMTAALLVGIGLAAQDRSQGKAAATIDCSVDGRALRCDRSEFLRRFAEAHTVAVESQPSNRMSDGQIATFIKSVGKQVAPTSSSDLLLRVVRPAPTGFREGPADSELGTLRVFALRGGSQESRLVWIERLNGQADMPWPAVVRALTGQLQATIAGR